MHDSTVLFSLFLESSYHVDVFGEHIVVLLHEIEMFSVHKLKHYLCRLTDFLVSRRGALKRAYK